MKKFLLVLFMAVTCLAVVAQSNFSFTNAKYSVGTYTDISSTGTLIAMSNAENGSSAAPINIGFNFIFNGTTFNQCMIHADGILRFGTDAPGSHPSLVTGNNFAAGAVFTSTSAAYQNVVLPLFMDLVQGSATPLYHVLTQGSAPNRITTIQWKNVRDNSNAAGGVEGQFDNMEFQVKLYETTNDIQVVYGNFQVSNLTSNVSQRGAAAGVKGSSTSFIGVKKTSSSIPFGTSEFLDPVAHSVFNAGITLVKTITPPNGMTFTFYGQRTTDISIAEAYVDASVVRTTSASSQIKVRIKNEGSAALSNIDVTMQISGANIFNQTINVATLAAGANQVINFSAYDISNAGSQQVKFTASVAGDERAENNIISKTQLVSNSFVQPLADSLNQSTGVGFSNISNNEIAVKMYGTGTHKIAQVTVPFNNFTSNITLKILDDDGTGNTPGTVLFTAAARNTNNDNETIFNLVTPVTVEGDYYIAVRQNATINMGWQFALQYPIHPDRIYNGNGTSYTLQAADRSWHPLVKVVEESSLPDVGIVAVTDPACAYSSTSPVTVSLRNYSSAVHDFVLNPVTISGMVMNDVTNTIIPFSLVKNTGTLAAGAIEPVSVLSTYDFSIRARHRFIAKTEMTGDAEPQNDSLSYLIVNSLRHTRSFVDSVCPFTPVTITAASNVYSNIQWNINGSITSGNTITFTPSQTSLVKVTATDYRGCAINDSILVPIRVSGLPPAPLVIFNDTLLSYHNGFTSTLSVSNLEGHSVTWQGGGIVSNGGSTYSVSGFRGADPETHLAYYTNIATGCNSNGTAINTRFAAGLLMNNSNTEILCDTSFYDGGGSVNPYFGSNNFTKTFYPAKTGSKVKLTFYNLNLGQFASLAIYDGTSTSAPRLDQFSLTTTNSVKEYLASGIEGAITVSFVANSSTGSGWLAGIECITPLQFRSVRSGSFTEPFTWESKLPTSVSYTPASRRPFKGDSTIIVRHLVTLPAGTMPLDETIIESAGTLVIPPTSSVQLYSDKPGYEMVVNGALTVNGNIFGSPGNSENGKIAVSGTLNVLGTISIDSVVVVGPGTPATINPNNTGTISRLQVNNPAGVNVNSNLNISRALDLRNGIVNLPAANFIRLVSGFGPVIAGGSANSYVNGKLRWQKFSSSDPIVFPVGKNGTYRKIELLANQTSFDDNVEYEAELFTGAPPVRTLPAAFTHINQQWYHKVSITNGSSRFTDATATIYYEDSDGVVDASALRVGKDDGGNNWIDLGGTATGTPAGSITTNTFTGFSDFVLANFTGSPLPVALISFTGTLVNRSVHLNWRVQQEQRFGGYAIERSTDGVTFLQAGFVTANGGIASSGYQYTDAQLPAVQVLYYRLKLVDLDGNFRYSNIIKLKLDGRSENVIVSVSPNPFVNRLVIQYQSATNENISLQLLDMNGKVLKKIDTRVSAGVSQLYLDAGDLPAGMYLMKLVSAGVTTTNKIIKQ